MPPLVGCLALIALLHHQIGGDRVITAGPLGYVSEASVIVMVVEPATIRGQRVIPLFGSASSRLESLENSLSSQISDRLNRAGIRVSEFRFDSPATVVGITISGGKFENTKTNFFNVSVAVQHSASDINKLMDVSVLGASEDAGLEASLARAALQVIDGVLDDRLSWQVSHPTPVGQVKFAISGLAVPGCPDASRRGPVPVGEPAFEYPRAAVLTHMSGPIEAKGRTLKDGTTASLEIVKGINPLLDATAMRGLAAQKFKPASCGGEPVEASFTATVTFSLIYKDSDKK